MHALRLAPSMAMPDRLAAASANLARPQRFSSTGATTSGRTDHDSMANAIRALAMDAVEQAKSGHPGLPMGAADIATVLFTRFLKFDPADPAWPDRDRFAPGQQVAKVGADELRAPALERPDVWFGLAPARCGHDQLELIARGDQLVCDAGLQGVGAYERLRK